VSVVVVVVVLAAAAAVVAVLLSSVFLCYLLLMLLLSRQMNMHIIALINWCVCGFVKPLSSYNTVIRHSNSPAQVPGTAYSL